ncbi:interleukin-3-like [Meriones unguiculatus]|uniref:interleukin-3-like n=1 Tax=Meriones unguiculatus TaxID=10047 RepID=UPI000B4F3EDD|nr:interleukin-3-like [Meriones unguiculatus]
MVLASSTTRVLSTLLLLLMLLHQGLQASVRSSTTYHSSSGTTSALNCKFIAKEIRGRLSDKTLQRANLHEFLKKQQELDPKDDIGIKSNLQKLECCLPAAEGTSEKSGIFIGNLTDFKQKLKFFVSNLEPLSNPRPSHSTSSPTTECENS